MDGRSRFQIRRNRQARWPNRVYFVTEFVEIKFEIIAETEVENLRHTTTTTTAAYSEKTVGRPTRNLL